MSTERALAEELIGRLSLRPHPEGGWFAESWRAEAPEGIRPGGSAIYYLLQRGECSAWHRVDATEIWHFYAGDPLELRTRTTLDGPGEGRRLLGPDLGTGARPQLVVPPGVWQSAVTVGALTLVGCTVCPAFTYEGFELAGGGGPGPSGTTRGSEVGS